MPPAVLLYPGNAKRLFSSNQSMLCSGEYDARIPTDRRGDDAVSVVIEMSLPLVQQAVSALAGHDPRFVLASSPQEDPDRRRVALIDTLHVGGNRRPLLASAAVAGYVLLSRQPTSPGVARDPYGNLVKIELPRDASWQQVAEALLRVAAEARVVAQRPVAFARVDWRAQRAALSSLTRREHQVLGLIASGMSVPEIARGLHLADSTVDNHRSRLLRKLGVRKSLDAARFAYRHGLASP